MEFLTYQQVKEKIRYYKERGFQIRFPGGTSYFGDKNAIVITPVFNSFGKVAFVIIPYQVDSGLPIVLGKRKESPKSLAARKLFDETGLIAEDENLVKVGDPILLKSRKGREKHTKYCFLLKSFHGGFLNLDNSSFLSRETGTPFTVHGPLLAHELYHGHLVFFAKAVDSMFDVLQKDDYCSIMREIIKRKPGVDWKIHLEHFKEVA